MLNWAVTFLVIALIEEYVKYLPVKFLIEKRGEFDEPVDAMIYMMTAALGFAALENALFLLKPFTLGNTAVGLLTGQLRFLGSTLLHTISSGTIGISMGLSFYMGGLTKKLYVLMGIVAAIALHSAFNFFIIQNEGGSILKVLAFLWIGAIMVMLLFEKLRRMNPKINSN